MPHTILCIEDNAQNMRLVRKILQHAGYQVLEAENGIQGVESAIQNTPDLVLMDINLPDIDGTQATQRIKSAHPTLPIIALTANAMYGDEERILSAGCDGYLSKPIAKDDLLRMLSEFLA
jgi:two-component system, cell cycle response regulator DivK